MRSEKVLQTRILWKNDPFMVVNTIKTIGLRATDFRTGKFYFSLFREIKVASYTFRLRPIHGISLKEINFFEPKCNGPLPESRLIRD